MSRDRRPPVSLTLDPAHYRIRIHKQTLQSLGNPIYVQFLVNPEEGYIAILGSDRPISGGTANRVRLSGTKGSPQQSAEFYSSTLISRLSNMIGGADLRYNYRMTGTVDHANRVAYFSFEALEYTERRRKHCGEGI